MANNFPQILLKPSGDLYELHQEVTYTFNGNSITIPAGYQYDGASIPRIFWSQMGSPFDPRFMTASLPHDKCYDSHELPKHWADLLFLEVLLDSGVEYGRASLMFEAVHLFGQSHWDS